MEVGLKIYRRNILKIGLVQAVVGIIASKAEAKDLIQGDEEFKTPPQIEKRSTPSILQGATDNSKTQFSVVYNSEINLEIFAIDSMGQKWSPEDLEVISMPGQPFKITKAYFSNLSVEDKYSLIVLNLDNQTQLDKREFRTLDTTAENLRFAMCSCMAENEHRPEIWQNLVKQNPQVIFFTGDHVYADSGAPSTGANPAHLWKRFCEARMILEIFYSEKLIPIIAVWDDHDFGLNDAHSENYPYVKESQENFTAFFAQEEKYCDFLVRGPGISTAFQCKSQLVLLLDDRSFRKPKGSKDIYAHWGELQEKWMFELMHKQSGPTWFINGSQIVPAIFWKESVSGDHSEQFKGLIAGIRKLSSKIIFASGDVHYSEISKIEKEMLGYQTYEVTSSSMHSKNIPGAPDVIPNKRRMIGTGKRNYVLIDSTAAGTGASFSVISYGIDGNILFRKDLTV